MMRRLPGGIPDEPTQHRRVAGACVHGIACCRQCDGKPHAIGGRMNLEWLGVVAATCTTLSFVPQAVKTIQTRDTSGISLWMYLVFTVGIGFWFGYGIVLNSWPMIVSNAITFLLSATILGLKLKHG